MIYHDIVKKGLLGTKKDIEGSADREITSTGKGKTVVYREMTHGMENGRPTRILLFKRSCNS